MTDEFLKALQKEQVAPTTEQKKTINRLHKLIHRLRRVECAFAAASVNEQLQSIQTAITSYTDEKTARDFLRPQIGFADDGSMTLDEADLEGLPPHAVQRFFDMYNRRLKSIWPWLTLVGKDVLQKVDIETPSGDFQRDASEFMQLYHGISVEVGLAPAYPLVKNVPKQRWIPHASRTLASHLDFYTAIKDTASISTAAQAVVDSINTARSSYAMHDLHTLQQIMIAKASFTATEIDALQQDGLWDNHEDLTYMCVDRGLRDTLLGHYGIMRDMFGGSTSGYATGQRMILLNSVIRGSLRVS